MKIAFVTASLDPGRDGVGDYSRRLARACAAQGDEACLLALNEAPDARPVAETSSSELRLNSGLPWKARADLARDFLNRQSPDWISVQFVCYGYSPNGISSGIEYWLKAVTSGFRVQIMFHELWIGHWRNASLKERIVGAVQKRSIANLVRAIQPELIHTSIPAYVELLAKSGFEAQRLPLFGNIPIAPRESSARLIEQGDATLTAGLFGSLHPNWPPEPLLNQFQEFCAAAKKQAVVAHIGRMGPGTQLWTKLSAEYAGRIKFIEFGERSPAEISTFLQSVDFGIAASPLPVLSKSGSVIAMLEHGCPVVVNWHENSADEHRELLGNEPLLHVLQRNFDFGALQLHTPQPRLAGIANQFVDELKAVPEPAFPR